MTTATCPKCNSDRISKKHMLTYRYRESGLDNVMLHGGVTETRCKSCRSRYYAIRKEPQLLQVIAMSLLMKPGPLTGPEMRYLRHACDLTQAELASQLRVRRPTVAERERATTSKVRPDAECLLRMRLLRAFVELLDDPTNNHLARSHMKRIDHFLDDLLTHIDEIIQEKSKFRLSLLNKHDKWVQDRKVA